MEYSPKGSTWSIGANSEMEALSHFHIIELSNLTVPASLPHRIADAKNRFLRQGRKI
jgi:hypothetical protein